MRPLVEAATRLASQLDRPAYDCLYLALAEALTTADMGLVARAAASGGRSRALMLTDIAAP